MEWNDVEQNWKQMRGEFKQKFDKLSDQDLRQVGGKRRKLEEMIQKKYEVDKPEATKRVDRVVKGLKEPKQKR